MESKENLSLSLDILYEILSLSSLQTLGRCRVVSKEWNSLTYQPAFMNLHSERTNTISGYLIQSERRDKYPTKFVSVDENLNSCSEITLNFLPGFVKIEASTKQGILLCTDDTTQHRITKYYVCKPSTKQWQQIPNPRTQSSTKAIGLIVLRSNPNLHYKIVRFSRHEPDDYRYGYQYPALKCEVFDSKTWAWKLLKDMKDVNPSFGFAPAVSVCGSLHWLTYDGNILSFHENEETYSLISLPEQIYPYKKLVDYEGKLALICMEQEQNLMELWVMENYGKKLWNKRQAISIETLKRKVPHASPVAFYNSELALMKECYQVILFNFKSGSTNIVRLGNYIDVRGIFPFQSDFELINWMIEPRKSKSKLRTSVH